MATATAALTGRTAAGWNEVPVAPDDPIFGLNAKFKIDTHPWKISLVIGAYRTDKGEPYVLPVVKKVEMAVANDPDTDHEYLPIDGLPRFRKLTACLILGNESKAMEQGRVATVQALSGTGALRLGFEYIKEFFRPGARVYIPDPTWGNHKAIVPEAGLGSTLNYRYYSNELGGLDFPAMMADLDAADDQSVVLLHGCAHNPTGADPSPAQWEKVLELVQRKDHLVLFDCAYQGFATGDLHADSSTVRLFVDAGLTVIIAQSYAKNMGLYGERVGALSVVAASREIATAALSQLKVIIRAMYSSPPGFGAKVVERILDDPQLFAEWEEELKSMADRIKRMRTALRRALEENGTPGRWNHVTEQIGMFSFTGLTKAQVDFLQEKHHIYMTSNGRISMAALNSGNMPQFAEAVKDAVVSCPSGVHSSRL